MSEKINLTGKVPEDQLMSELGIRSRTTLNTMRRSGQIKVYSFGDGGKNYYDLEEVRQLFKEKEYANG